MSTQSVNPDPNPQMVPSVEPVAPSKRTYLGYDVPAIGRGLPRPTETLCPDCDHTNVIPGRLFEEGGKVFMEKTCQEHGYVKELIFSDVKLYLKLEDWTFADGDGLTNPRITDATKCPEHWRHVQYAHVPYRARERRLDESLRHDLSGLFRQRQRGRLHLRAGAAADPGHAADAPRHAAGGGAGRPVLGRRADQLSLLRWSPSASPRSSASRTSRWRPTASASPTSPASPSAARRRGCIPSICSSTASSDDVYLRTRGEKVWETKKRCVAAGARGGPQDRLRPDRLPRRQRSPGRATS